ncbi:MAG: hypothetical protein ACYC69_10935 [Thermodesulfovibrionales bacterium]
MKILHILNDGPSRLSDRMIPLLAQMHEIRVIDLTKMDCTYDELVDEIFAADRVVSW